MTVQLPDIAKKLLDAGPHATGATDARRQLEPYTVTAAPTTSAWWPG